MISLLPIQIKWLRIFSLPKRAERGDINSAFGGSIFSLQFRFVRVRVWQRQPRPQPTIPPGPTDQSQAGCLSDSDQRGKCRQKFPPETIYLPPFSVVPPSFALSTLSFELLCFRPKLCTMPYALPPGRRP